MKKIILLFMFLFLFGCELSNNPSSKVSAYLDNYNVLSDEFLSFDVRVEKANIKLEESLAKKDMGLFDAMNNYASAVAEAKLNPNYDFNRLSTGFFVVLRRI